MKDPNGTKTPDMHDKYVCLQKRWNPRWFPWINEADNKWVYHRTVPNEGSFVPEPDQYEYRVVHLP